MVISGRGTCSFTSVANARNWPSTKSSKRPPARYLEIARVVYFANSDIELVRGSGEARRRFLDFFATQCDATYRQALRDYERALRSRNLLLKGPSPRWREIAAFDEPLLDAGQRVSAARAKLVAELQMEAKDAHRAISSRAREALQLAYVPGAGRDFAATLADARNEDARLRQTSVGPHRDDLLFTLNGQSSTFASEGQQRTLVLALKLGVARLLERRFGVAPVLLLDDIFGELDLSRRAALARRAPGLRAEIDYHHAPRLAASGFRARRDPLGSGRSHSGSGIEPLGRTI